MTLLTATKTGMDPILNKRARRGFTGEVCMTKVKLRLTGWTGSTRTGGSGDTLPFPTMSPRRPGLWQPRLADDGPMVHGAETALEEAQGNLDRLKSLLDADDDDRPRAA